MLRQLACSSVMLLIYLSAFVQTPSPAPPATPTPAKGTAASATQEVTETSPTKSAVNTPKTNGARPEEQSSAKPGAKTMPASSLKEGIEILSNTRGVDFSAYMAALHTLVQSHWEPLMPATVLPPVRKSGRVVITFAIRKDGSISALRVESSSGDTSLDRAAYGAITNSAPFPKLPLEFTGDYLLLRCPFVYNPGRMSAEPSPQPQQTPSPSPAPSQPK